MGSEDFSGAGGSKSPETGSVAPPGTVGARGVREQRDQLAAEARRRYHALVVAAFGVRGVPEADVLADVALDALTDWRQVGTGEVCRCSCHPQLPISDRHDYGFDCMCTNTREEQRRALDSLRVDNEAFWKSPAGQEIIATQRVEHADLQEWVASQSDVEVYNDGDFVPEEWHGEVAGHRFYFRERWGEWRVEIDLRPSGRYVPTVIAVAATGEPRIEPRETEVGDVIASGDTTEEGYGTTLCERAQFIVGQIRQHLVRATCTLHTGNLTAVEDLVGDRVRWCPACGTPLAG